MERTYIKQIGGKYYAFASVENSGQVMSIGADNPKKKSGASRWYAGLTDNGIKYVASPSPNRQAAVSKAIRNGKYFGEMK